MYYKNAGSSEAEIMKDKKKKKYQLFCMLIPCHLGPQTSSYPVESDVLRNVRFSSNHICTYCIIIYSCIIKEASEIRKFLHNYMNAHSCMAMAVLSIKCAAIEKVTGL